MFSLTPLLECKPQGVATVLLNAQCLAPDCNTVRATKKYIYNPGARCQHKLVEGDNMRGRREGNGAQGTKRTARTHVVARLAFGSHFQAGLSL